MGRKKRDVVSGSPSLPRTPLADDPRSKADTAAAFTDTVRAFERLVHEHPAQWLTFEDVWRDAPVEPMGAYETVPKVSRARRK